MTPKDWIEILAVLLSPLIALQVSELIRGRQEQRNRRFEVFRALMATRAANLTVSHVEALNMIVVAFYGSNKKSKAVVEACKVYLDHHNNSPGAPNWGDK